MSEKKKKWRKFRHRVVKALAYAFFYPYSVMRYGIHVESMKRPGKQPYLLLSNHQTAFDQFFVGMIYRGPVYYVASEDLFSNGFVSGLLRYAVAPIPIRKQTTDIRSVMNCIKVAKEGGTIAIAPEGNRTFSGRTEYIKPSIVGLVRVLKLPVAFIRIEGGYGVQPRWSDVVRKGKMRAYVSRILTPEETARLTDDELLQLICSELTVNDFEQEGIYRHKKLAEYLERVFYVCPDCGFSVLRSERDTVTCTKCGKKIRYLPDRTFQGVGFDFPLHNALEWYDFQSDYVNSFNLTADCSVPLFEDRASYSEVILYQKKKILAKTVELKLYGDRITLDFAAEHIEYPFRSLDAVTVLGRNKLNIYFQDHVFQFKGDKRFNAVKYVNFYHRYRNLQEGNEHGKFLGL